MIDLGPHLARYRLFLADLSAPSGSVTMSARDRRTRLLRDLVSEGHTAVDIATAFGIHEQTVLRRCRMAGIELVGGHHVEPRPAETHVPGLVACREDEAQREDCIHEAACLGRLVAEHPSAQAARCRPGCARRTAPDRDERLRLAMAGGIGYGHCCPQHG